MTDRITKISLGKYDQVIAVTQHMINSGVKNLWKAHSDDPQVTAFTFDLGLWTGSLDGVYVDAPVVQVIWSPSSQNQLLYLMNFKAGTLKIQTLAAKPGNKPTFKTYNMAGWSIGVPVILTHDELKPDDPVYKQKVASQPPGQYSVTRLLVTIAAGTSAIDFEKSKLPGVNWKQDWDDTTRKNATQIFNQLLEGLFDFTLNTVGYAVTSNNVQLLKKEHPAEFQPTGLRLQTYPWVEPGKDTNSAIASGLSGNARLNYLCYLEMTNGRTLPGATDATLPYKGNWTDGRLDTGADIASMDFGNFAMSRRLFLETYVFKKLRRINRAMEPRVKDLDNRLYWNTKPFTFSYSWNCDCKVGYNVDHPNADDEYFDFKLKPGTTDTYVFKSIYNSDQPGMGNLWDHKDLGWGVETWGQIGCDCENTLKFTAGSPEIVINGKSHVKLYYSNKNLATDDDTLNFTATWSMTLTLQAVNDGGLQIAVKADKPVTEKNFVLKQATLNSYGTYLEKSYQTALSNLSQLQTELANDIAGQQKFYFPASGTFFFKNPVLNYDGALICQIGYNGTDDFRNPNEVTQRINVQPKADGAAPQQPGAISGSLDNPKGSKEDKSGTAAH